MFLCAFIFRKEAGFYFPQLVRIACRLAAEKKLRSDAMLALAEVAGGAFLTAVMRFIFARRFKSKRFIARSLRVGERLASYYDGFALRDVRKNRLAAITVNFYQNGQVYASDGRVFKYTEGVGTLCEVWPETR